MQKPDRLPKGEASTPKENSQVGEALLGSSRLMGQGRRGRQVDPETSGDLNG